MRSWAPEQRFRGGGGAAAAGWRAARSPRAAVRVRAAPKSWSSTSTRRTWRWSGCSVVKPMPASTCWQWRAAVRAPRPASALAIAAVRGVPSSHAASSTASAVSMATSVSASRWRTAWNWLIGRSNWTRSSACSPGQLEHRPRRADELVADARAGASGDRAVPSPRPARRPGDGDVAAVTSTRPQLGIDAAAPAAATAQRSAPRPRRPRRRSPATTTAAS